MTLATKLELLDDPSTTPGANRRFVAGSFGWTVDDLTEDAALADRFCGGRMELVEGVLAQLPPAGAQGVSPLSNLRDVVYDHLKATGQWAKFHHEADVLLRPRRIPRPDMIALTAEQTARQTEIALIKGLDLDQYRPFYVVPILIVESLSKGTEDHDRVTKRRWYRLAGVPHYWLLSAGEQSLECLMLDAGRYRRAAFGRGAETIRAPIFGGVEIPLAKVWG